MQDALRMFLDVSNSSWEGFRKAWDPICHHYSPDEAGVDQPPNRLGRARSGACSLDETFK